MKCKNLSNKINNFVVRKLKSFKINGQQQALTTMPAMPKEKSSPIPLTDSNFTEIKMKEQLSAATSMTAALTSQLIDDNKISTPSDIITTGTTTTTATQVPIKSFTVGESSPSTSSGLSQTTTTMASTTTIPSRGMATNLISSRNDNKSIHHHHHHHHNYHNQHNHHLSNSNTVMSMTSNPGSLQHQISSNGTPISSRTSPNCGCGSVDSGELFQRTSSTPLTTPALATATTTTTTTTSRARDNIVGARTQQRTPPSSTSRTTTTTSTSGVPGKKSPNDYVFGKYIGEGSYSTVYLARDIHTNKEYAIKVCDKLHIIREKKQEYIRREREVMHMMNNVPGFVNLSCTFQDYRSLYFVMTYAKNGDLLPYINKVGSFDLECTRHYAAELVLAIENMHKRNVVHRDLKPENILLDENMHTLIADFGSAKILTAEKDICSRISNNINNSDNSSSSDSNIQTSTARTRNNSINRKNSHDNDNERRNVNNDSNDDDDDDDDDDDVDRPTTRTNRVRRRQGSFVGTAQYVSPEVLQGNTITKSADLWALGCIIYQMISGLPPFRGGSDYLIFQQIMKLNLVFPDGFDKNAEDLVRSLLRIHPDERIGSQDKCGHYESIRTHPFFEGINFDTIRMQTPPQIYPYLPGVHNKDEELRSHYRVPDNLEPGLDDRQLTRLLGLELGTVSGNELEKKTEPKNILNITETEKQRRLEAQKSDKWNQFVDGEVILKKGFVNKRKGLFARKRMLLLTTGPRLIYVDPVQMVKKGEIPWTPELRVEPKNFKIFFVHTKQQNKLKNGNNNNSNNNNNINSNNKWLRDNKNNQDSSPSSSPSSIYPRQSDNVNEDDDNDNTNQYALMLQPNRTYYLEDPEGYALEWVEAIEDVRQKTYGDKS